MKKQPWVNVVLAGINLTEFGLMIPSPFSSLEIENSEITSATAWTLTCVVGGDNKRKINVAAFEALLYSAAQEAYGYKNSSGIPVSFAYGWIDERGQVEQYTSYQGFTLKFKGYAGIVRTLKNTPRGSLTPLAPKNLQRLMAHLNRAFIVDFSSNKCLAYSLALCLMARRAGHDARLIVGVRTRPFASHAWVEHDREVLNDDPDLRRKLAVILEL